MSDLERHLPADWWRTLFNSVYLKTDGDVVEDDRLTRLEVDRLLEAGGLRPQDRILDLCCGQGRHLLELARRGFRQLTGIDRSRYLVRLARRRGSKLGLQVRFREGDARRFGGKPGSFDAVLILGNSFGYFESESEDLAVLRAVRRALRERGRVLLDLADGEWLAQNFEARSWEWIDQDHFVCRERSLGARSRLVTREVVVHAERGVIADQFYAERLYTREEVQGMLEAAGFEEVEVAAGVETTSARGQDLGMMARRNLFLARALGEEDSEDGSRGHGPVHVLLGDPTLPDDIKRDGHFNPEDHDTVRRLKEALATLGRDFQYLDRHQSLFEDLRRDEPEFVLNFCDEGFSNDARRELHVPAMLEVQGIPYSGAAPACLAVCYDKGWVSAVASSLGIPVPSETVVAPGDQSATLPSVFPALVKPTTGDSSIGITCDSVVHDSTQLVAAVSRLHRAFPDRALLVQEFLTGAEYSVGVIGNPGIGLEALPILEVDYDGLDPAVPRILGYESKWEPDSASWTQIRYRPAELDDDRRRSLLDHSFALFERLGCRDYARVDFRADARGEIKLLEMNPNPGWCWDGKLALMAGFGDRSYADLLRMVIDAAEARVHEERRAVRAVKAPR